MKLRSKFIFVLLLFVCAACGGGSESKSSDQRFNGLWKGVLLQTQSSPEGCDSRKTLEEQHSIETYPEDIDGNTITIFDSLVIAGSLNGSEMSNDSFDVFTVTGNTLGFSETHIVYNNVSKGRASVILTYMGGSQNSNCSSSWMGEMVRSEIWSN